MIVSSRQTRLSLQDSLPVNTIEIFRTARIVIDQQDPSAATRYARERNRLSAERDDYETAELWERIETVITHIIEVGVEGVAH
jgi:hypothetical protein